MDEHIYTYPTQSAAFMDKIIKVVSLETGFPEEIICAKIRRREVVESRQLCHRLAKHFTNASLTDIGKRIGSKDHATILHSIKTINNLRDSDRKFSARYDTLLLKTAATIVDMKENTLVCKCCGNARIQIREWVDANTGKFIDTEDRYLATDNWCEECQSSTTILTYGEYNIYKNELATINEALKIKTIAEKQHKQQLSKLEKELGV